jgi:hypothetical protein
VGDIRLLHDYMVSTPRLHIHVMPSRCASPILITSRAQAMDFIENSFMSRKDAKAQRLSLLASLRLCVREILYRG